MIDIAVRPGYCGGPLQIIQAYRKGLETVDGLNIARTLAKLKHTYPYHQIVGYYMEKAGFGAEHLDPLKRIPMNFDFYIDYQIVESLYSSTWQLHYPAIWTIINESSSHLQYIYYNWDDLDQYNYSK